CMKEKFWERLVERIGLAHLRDDPRFRTFADRLAHRDALRPILRAEFLRHTTAEWIERLRGQVPIAPVYAVEEALADPQVLARERGSARRRRGCEAGSGSGRGAAGWGATGRAGREAAAPRAGTSGTPRGGGRPGGGPGEGAGGAGTGAGRSWTRTAARRRSEA